MIRYGSLAAAVVLLVGCHASSASDASTSGRSAPGPARTESASAAQSTPTTDTRDGHTATYFGPLTASYHQSQYSITLAPPPPGATPRQSWQAAFAACFGGPVGCVATGDAQVVLASVTGPPIAGHLMFDHQVAYVVVWGPSRCMTSSQTCRNAYLVSDRTGTVVFGFDVPATAGFPR